MQAHPYAKSILRDESMHDRMLPGTGCGNTAGFVRLIRDKGVRVIEVEALEKAIEAGSPKATNVVLLGVAARQMGLDKELWLHALRSTVPPKTIAVNEKAFALGYGE